MIKSISFKNFKGLRAATLPLGRFTLIVGPNASGKSTAMEALALAHRPAGANPVQIRSAGADDADVTEIRITNDDGEVSRTSWQQINSSQFFLEGPELIDEEGDLVGDLATNGPELFRTISSFRRYSFDPKYLSAPVQLTPVTELQENGANLAGVLDNLRDSDAERYENLNREIANWFPEFDRIVFETPKIGVRAFGLRTAAGHHKIMAPDLSDGTLLALGYLTLAFLPSPPALVCFEEPERGIHPRLLRNIQEAMYHLAYPDSFSDKREPIQVIATSHSPYFLDLFKDHPEEVVISHKDSQGVQFNRLSDQEHIGEFLQGASLGEIWYSGILGGVPAHP